MPQSDQNGGGGTLWNDENDFLSTAQSWLPTNSTSDSALTFKSKSQQHTRSADGSVVDHSGAGRDAIGVSQDVNFDFHRVQPWPVIPFPEQAQSSLHFLPANIGGDWRSFFDYTESALAIADTEGSTPSLPSAGQTIRRKRTFPSSQTSPTHSTASRSSVPSTNAATSISIRGEQNASHSAPKPSNVTSMNSRIVQASNTSQAVSTPKSLPGGTTFNAMKKMYTGSRTLEVDDDARRVQSTRGGSLVSTTSGFSRGEYEFPKSEVGGDDNTNRFMIQENRGAGRTPGVLRNGQSADVDQFTLPPGKGFPIQIGSELFRLSGASIMSDGQYLFHT